MSYDCIDTWPLHKTLYAMKNSYLFLVIIIILSCHTQKAIVEKHISESQSEMISYSIVGKGETIVFIHAGGLDKKMWERQLKNFGKKAHVIAYDIRGHGKSKSESNSKFEIDDLNSILAKENINNKINLVGCSLGAIIALDFAIAFPEKLERLILVSPGLIGFQEQNEEYLGQLSNYVKAIQEGNKNVMQKELKKMNAIGKEEREIDISIDKYVDERLKAFIESGNHLRIPSFRNLEPLKAIEKLNVKCLIMYGNLDFDYIKKNARKLNETIVNSEILEFQNSAHLINLEDEKLFNKKLIEFLDRE